VRREADAAVARPARRAHLAVAVLAPRGAHNVAALHRHDLAAAGAAPHARRPRRRHDLSSCSCCPCSGPRVRRRLRGRGLRRELVQVVVLAEPPKGQELRLEAVVVAGGVVHGREKGILGGRRPLPQRRRGLQVLELEDGDRRRLLRFLVVELQQPVLLLICFASCAVASVRKRNPVVVPRIQIPRLVRRRSYCCLSDRRDAHPSTCPGPITSNTRKQRN
jgi:hypothetical protein